MADLNGQHALITGGGTGVGAAIARCLSEAGAAITIAGRRLAPLQDLAKQLPKAQAIQCDVTDEESVAALFAAAAETFGPVTIAVANAGAAKSAPIGKTDMASDLGKRWLPCVNPNRAASFSLPVQRA